MGSVGDGEVLEAARVVDGNLDPPCDRVVLVEPEHGGDQLDQKERDLVSRQQKRAGMDLSEDLGNLQEGNHLTLRDSGKYCRTGGVVRKVVGIFAPESASLQASRVAQASGISIDDGATSLPISLVGKVDGKFAVLKNCQDILTPIKHGVSWTSMTRRACFMRASRLGKRNAANDKQGFS